MGATSELVAAARSIVESKEPAAELSGRIGSYADAFAEWFSSIEHQLQGGSVEGEERRLIEELLLLHQEVIRRAADLKEETAATLKGLKSKERGIIRYLGGDVRPAPVTRPRRG